MPEIIIRNLKGRKISVPEGCPHLLKAIHNEGIDWMFSCGGKGRCTTCAAKIIEGSELLSTPTGVEVSYRKQGRLTKNERLTCQCLHEEGTVVIETPKRYRFPHVDYTVGSDN